MSELSAPSWGLVTRGTPGLHGQLSIPDCSLCFHIMKRDNNARVWVAVRRGPVLSEGGLSLQPAF